MICLCGHGESCGVCDGTVSEYETVVERLSYAQVHIKFLTKKLADTESALRSAAIVEGHLRATIKALTTSGHYDGGKLEEGLDGQVLREGRYG